MSNRDNLGHFFQFSAPCQASCTGVWTEVGGPKTWAPQDCQDHPGTPGLLDGRPWSPTPAQEGFSSPHTHSQQVPVMTPHFPQGNGATAPPASLPTSSHLARRARGRATRAGVWEGPGEGRVSAMLGAGQPQLQGPAPAHSPWLWGLHVSLFGLLEWFP
uniref:Uncharacterized protein n=1 Tax=Myotis myotis TaxID=51298 RepID=A0A7J7R410_MYOMY|nr:hypothetical protein mMyoMyo1_010912 [Myotis myotis]